MAFRKLYDQSFLLVLISYMDGVIAHFQLCFSTSSALCSLVCRVHYTVDLMPAPSL